jgi:predicted ATPase
LAPALAAALPEVGEPLPVPPEAETGRLHDALSQLVLRLARDRPVALVVDDLHWADAATVATLRALARTTRASKVLLLGTYRDTDIDRRHPFAQALGVIQREAEPTRIELRGLSASAVQGIAGRPRPTGGDRGVRRPARAGDGRKPVLPA